MSFDYSKFMFSRKKKEKKRKEDKREKAVRWENVNRGLIGHCGVCIVVVGTGGREKVNVPELGGAAPTY